MLYDRGETEEILCNLMVNDSNEVAKSIIYPQKKKKRNYNGGIQYEMQGIILLLFSFGNSVKSERIFFSLIR